MLNTIFEFSLISQFSDSPPQQLNLHDHDYQPLPRNPANNNSSTPDRDQIIDIDSNDEDIMIVDDGQGAKRGRRSQRINYRELSPDEPGPSRKITGRRAPPKMHWKQKLSESQREAKSKEGPSKVGFFG